jgi:hypothetical protein
MAIEYSDFSKLGDLGLKTVSMTGSETPFPPLAASGTVQRLPDDLMEVLIRASGGPVNVTLVAGSSDVFPIEDGATLKLPAFNLPKRRFFLNGAGTAAVSILMSFRENKS